MVSSATVSARRFPEDGALESRAMHGVLEVGVLEDSVLKTVSSRPVSSKTASMASVSDGVLEDGVLDDAVLEARAFPCGRRGTLGPAGASALKGYLGGQPEPVR